MSSSADQAAVLDWPILLLIGFLLIGTIAIMLKLTVGSCYKPPSTSDQYEERKVR